MKKEEIIDTLYALSEDSPVGRIIPENRFELIAHELTATKLNPDSELISVFENFRLAYKKAAGPQGKVRGLDTEWKDFKKKHRDYSVCVHNLLDGLNGEVNWRSANKFNKDIFIANWANLKTWLSERRWEIDYAVEPSNKRGNINFMGDFNY